MKTEKAILAGGCFWGMEDLIRDLPGVLSTIVGYSGGDVPNATYRNHGTHAEAIAISFDPDILSYRKLLEFFFKIHNQLSGNWKSRIAIDKRLEICQRLEGGRFFHQRFLKHNGKLVALFIPATGPLVVVSHIGRPNQQAANCRK